MNEALEITKKGPKPRPLSPHLQIYKWQLTSLMSIGHRASGIALSLGSILIVTWLVTLASGPELFSIASLVISHWFGQFILFGFSVVLFYHLLNGIRHLSWDIGYGFNLSIVYKTGYAVLFTALFLTIVIGKSLSKVVTWTGVGTVDKTFGLLFGFFKGYIVSLCLFSILNWFYPYQNWGISAEDALSFCLLYTSPSPRDQRGSRMPSSA